MTRYLLNMWQPVGVRPDEATLAEAYAKLNALTEEMRSAGQWVFNGGLHPPRRAPWSAATTWSPTGRTWRARSSFGGFWIIEAPDLDAALEWARRSTGITTLPVEVRPFAT